MARRRRIYSLRRELLAKSREAALSAVQIFNNPLIQFKSESFIVLMIIAWTYLLHSYYREQKVDYRILDRNASRRRFERTKYGAIKHWQLEACLNTASCPVDRDTQNNLRFLIGLRNEIEHQMTLALDSWLSGQYQACALNYNRYVKELFGLKQGLDEHLMYSLQFVELSRGQVEGIATEEDVPPHLKAYIAEFDSGLTDEEVNNPSYVYRVHYTRISVNRPGQANQVMESFKPNSDVTKDEERQYPVWRDRERRKHLPGSILDNMHAEGFHGFNQHKHI